MPKKSLKTRPEITPHTREKIRDAKGRFLPGVSGNPGGRPRTAHLSQAYREELERIGDDDHTNAELVAKRMVKTAVHGRRDPAAIMAASELADRTEGKAQQSVHVEHGMDQRTAEIIANLAARWLDGQDIPPLYPKQTFQLPEPRALPDIRQPC